MNRSHLTIAAISAAALILTGCQSDDPDSSLPPLESETAEPTETSAPTEPADVTEPLEFDAPETEDEAIDQASQVSVAYQEVTAYLTNYDVDDDDRIEAWAQAGALQDALDRFATADENNITIEGAPTFEPDGGYASQGGDLDFGHVEVTGCLDLSTMTLIRDGVEQDASDERGEVSYSLLFNTETGTWLVQTSESTGEPC